MRKTAFLRTVALCLLAVMCLGSCGGEPMPPAVTTDAPATTESPATTAAPEPMPEPIILCEDGASPYRIVISTTATKYEKNAADLVQQYFLALTGIRLPIVSDQQERIDDPIGRKQVETLKANCTEFGIRHFDMGTKDNGIIHVVGPEKALSLPGMTIVCGDSHTSTHGAVGAIAMGIGTSEVAQVLASQTILQSKPKTMRINIEGTLPQGTTAKDVALYIMAQLTTSGATGYAVEYAGSTIRNMSMEGRLTLSNLSIEMGSRAGLIAPDEITFEYLKGREYAPKGEAWDKAVEEWKKLYSDPDAVFDKEVTYRAEDIAPRITYGTNPGAGIAIDECIPELESIPEADRAQFLAMLEYMQFQPGQKLEGTPVDYCFLGACTNGRIEDFRAFASVVKGKKKADNVVAWLVPGSWLVRQQIIDEGIDKILEEAGFELRLPSCSACLAMNPDKVPAGKLSISTSNRNFVGRQGPGARTILASPLVVAASAITGVVTDPRK